MKSRIADEKGCNESLISREQDRESETLIYFCENMCSDQRWPLYRGSSVIDMN